MEAHIFWVAVAVVVASPALLFALPVLIVCAPALLTILAILVILTIVSPGRLPTWLSESDVLIASATGATTAVRLLKEMLSSKKMSEADAPGSEPPPGAII